MKRMAEASEFQEWGQLSKLNCKYTWFVDRKHLLDFKCLMINLIIMMMEGDRYFIPLITWCELGSHIPLRGSLIITRRTWGGIFKYLLFSLLMAIHGDLLLEAWMDPGKSFFICLGRPDFMGSEGYQKHNIIFFLSWLTSGRTSARLPII